MHYKDYYETLGVACTATAKEIKHAYRKLAHKYHPRISKEADATEKFKDIAEAYRTPKDPEKHAAYNQLGQPRSCELCRPPPDWQGRYSNTRFPWKLWASQTCLPTCKVSSSALGKPLQT